MDRLIPQPSRSRFIPALFGVGIAAVILAGTGFVAASRHAPTRQADAAAPLTTVRVVMGYGADVQFAPFYAAVKLGYYRAAGLNVSFNYATEPNALQLLSSGSVDFVDSGGDEVLAAGAAGLHVKYVMTQYSRFPSALFFLKSSGITKVSDLKGKTIGVPAENGASYYGLLALLGANGVPASSVQIESIGYAQVSEVAAGKVNAAMGYAPNEPVELRSTGKSVGEFDVYHWANIAGAGLATSTSMIAHKPALVRAFVRATLHGLRYTISHPKKAFTISAASIPNLTNLSLQRQVLNRAIDFWKPAGVALGRMDPNVWRKTADVLYRYKVVTKPVTATSYYTNQFVK